MTVPVRVLTRLFVVESVRALSRHKLRTTLTALGSMVGVAAVIWVVAIGRAGTAVAEAELANLGDNLVWVEAGSRNVNGVRSGSHGMTSLTPDDAEAIRRDIPLVKAVAENVDGNAQMVYGHRNWNARWRGVSPEYFEVKRWVVVEGSFFTDYQVRNVDSVVVIGETVRQRLFGAASPVGELVRVQASIFRVVGLLGSKGQTASGQDQDDVIMLPWTTAQKKLKGKGYEWLDDILCSAVSPEAVNPAVSAIAALIRQRHHIRADADDDFNMRRPDEVINAQIAASQTLKVLLVILAAIALLVGGIGIMNVMLASVTQRTREIGVRMAVGATPRAVQAQFLGEAAILSLVGGVLGVLFSIGGVVLIEPLIGWKLSTQPDAALVAVVFSVLTGLFFGFFPAWHAARLDPIVALRDE
ncbi:MAG TPA: ABC transporter permease [Polyangia bacterium]|jgi:putative ABC transport system permease protein|nr:ABC transporter permease [Polyangia bacterium]